jgi:hypothetical protein
MYTVSFGRCDGSAHKYIEYRSRIRALFCANSMAYVLFYQHPFRSSEAHGTVRAERDGFYVEFSEERKDGHLDHTVNHDH